MAKLIGYARVSGEGQRENTSLPVQMQAISDYCRKHGHELYCIFQDVASAATIEQRKGLTNALELLFSGYAEGLVVYRLDRFCRNFLDAERGRQRFQREGKLLLSISDPVEIDTADGAMFYALKASFNEFERKQIKLRCDFGRQKAKEQGRYIGGQPPYGWVAAGRMLVPEPQEQEVIDEIFRLQQKGYSLRQIAIVLNEFGFKTKKGRTWKSPQVYSVLKSAQEIRQRIEQRQEVFERYAQKPDLSLVGLFQDDDEEYATAGSCLGEEDYD